MPGLRFCGGATKMVRPFPMNERYVEWSTPWPEAERMGSERIKFSSIIAGCSAGFLEYASLAGTDRI